MNRHKSHSTRNTRGSVLGCFSLGSLLFFGFSVSVFAYDMSNYVSVTSQLQYAADAGALAGAHDLCFNDGKGGYTADPQAAKSYAKDASSACKYVIKKTVGNCSISTFPCQHGVKETTPPGGWSKDYFMTVKVEKKVHNIFGSCWGHSTDTITVIAIAGPLGSACKPPTSSTYTFPLAVVLSGPNKNSPVTAGANGSFECNPAQPLYIDGQLGAIAPSQVLAPFMENCSNAYFVAGPQGKLGGGAIGWLGNASKDAMGDLFGGDAGVALSQMEYFAGSTDSPSIKSSSGKVNVPPPKTPASVKVGQYLYLVNPGTTDLSNLKEIPAAIAGAVTDVVTNGNQKAVQSTINKLGLNPKTPGPFVAEDFMQGQQLSEMGIQSPLPGTLSRIKAPAINPPKAPYNDPNQLQNPAKLAPWLMGKTLVVPVISQPTSTKWFAGPLLNALKGGAFGGKVVGFAKVQFASCQAMANSNPWVLQPPVTISTPALNLTIGAKEHFTGGFDVLGSGGLMATNDDVAQFTPNSELNPKYNQLGDCLTMSFERSIDSAVGSGANALMSGHNLLATLENDLCSSKLPKYPLPFTGPQNAMYPGGLCAYDSWILPPIFQMNLNSISSTHAPAISSAQGTPVNVGLVQ